MRPFTELRHYVIGAIVGALLAALLVGQPAQASYAPSLIKSVQYGTCTIADTVTSGTATITAVTVAKTVLVFLGNDGLDNIAGARANFTRITLTNTTTVGCARANGNGGAVTAFAALEFY